MENVSLATINAVAELLSRLANDNQHDKSHPGYLGFINVGHSLFIDIRDKITWLEITDANNAYWVIPLIKAFGLKIEGKFDIEETAFIRS